MQTIWENDMPVKKVSDWNNILLIGDILGVQLDQNETWKWQNLQMQLLFSGMENLREQKT